MMEVTPIRPDLFCDPVPWPELAALGLTNDHPHVEWICDTYLLGRQLIELARLCSQTMPEAALGNAMLHDILSQARELFGEEGRAPREMTCFQEELASDARLERLADG